jgi:hypothetical protein
MLRRLDERRKLLDLLELLLRRVVERFGLLWNRVWLVRTIGMFLVRASATATAFPRGARRAMR